MPLDVQPAYPVVARFVGPAPLHALAALASGLAGTIDVWRDRLREYPDRRTGLRLTATQTYDAWLLRWPPETSVDPHHHGESAGALALATGELLESRWDGTSTRVRRLGPDEVVTFERGEVHEVMATSQTSLSVAVYSPPLKTMWFYDPAGRASVERVDIDGQDSTFAELRTLNPARST